MKVYAVYFWSILRFLFLISEVKDHVSLRSTQAPCLGIASPHTVQFGLPLPCREIQDPWILSLVMILTSVMDWYLPDSIRHIYLFIHFETSRILVFFIVPIMDNECKVLISSHEKENISVRQASVLLIMSNNGYIVGFVDIYKSSCLFCSTFWIISYVKKFKSGTSIIHI